MGILWNNSTYMLSFGRHHIITADTKKLGKNAAWDQMYRELLQLLNKVIGATNYLEK